MERTRICEFMRLEERYESSACNSLCDAKHENIFKIHILRYILEKF